MSRIAIIGGGITGLTTAYKLSKADPDAEITVIESDRRVGGKIDTRHSAGLLVEAGAESFLSRKPWGVALCEELGIADQLIGRRPENHATFIKHGDTLYPLPEGLSGFIPTDLDALTNNPLFTDEGRARIAKEAEIPPREDDEDESLESFVTRRFGYEAYVRLIEPLMSGIYGGKGSELSIMATFPQLRQMEKQHGSLLKGLTRPKATDPPTAAYPPFVSFPNGMQTLIDTLKTKCDEGGVMFRLRHDVRSILRHSDGSYTVLTGRSGPLDVDGVIITTPAYVTAGLVHPFAPALSEELQAFSYNSSAQVTLAFKTSEVSNDLRGYGYIISREQAGDALACTWSSQKWAHRADEETRLLRVFLGRQGQGGQDVTLLEDSELIAMARNELRETVGITAEPIFETITRWPNGMPQYTLGHLERVESVEAKAEKYPGLALAGAPYRGVGIPDCIRSGTEAAAALLAELDPKPVAHPM